MKELFFEMLDSVDGVPLTSKRHRLRTYPNCFNGHELLTWLIDNDKSHDQQQALAIGQALLDARHVRCLIDINTSTFYNDSTLYEFRELTRAELQYGQRHMRQLSTYSETVEDLPGWIQELDHNEQSKSILNRLLRTWSGNTNSVELILKKYLFLAIYESS